MSEYGWQVVPFMEQVLDTIVETFETAGVDLPDRRYITFATPASDCAQLTVALQQLYLGPPGLPAQEATPCTSPTTATIRVEVLRPVPIPDNRNTAPTQQALIESAKEQMRDAEVLLDSVRKMCGRGWGGMGVFADVTMGMEQGGLAGPVLNITAGVP